jgi:hypothetical protein
MTNVIDEEVTLPHQDVPIKLWVHGIWIHDHIALATVKHGDEYLQYKHYPVLIDAAVTAAEKKHKHYVEEQEEIKDSIISRLCYRR